MPAKNIIKSYTANGFYHVYNRGVNKMVIFQDAKDYHVFLSYLKTYLLPKNTKQLTAIIIDPKSSQKDKEKARKTLRLNNFHGTIQLSAYCLMPNHFHLLIKQQNETDMERIMRSLMTRYTMYFNRRYKRIGPLFQGAYKAVLITTDEQLLYLTRYIHRNPLGSDQESSEQYNSTAGNTMEILMSRPSSYQNYLKKIEQDWVKPEFVLHHFSNSGFNSYQSFVEAEDFDHEQKSVRLLSKFTLD